MDSKLYTCCKCFLKFPLCDLSSTDHQCKDCQTVRTSSSFKQCKYCKSDFRITISGDQCPKCKSLDDKYGPPAPCSICQLSMAFGTNVICMRCTHYRVKFGEPSLCQKCGNKCAFVKDEESRRKVEGQILCWLCTYNFKLARSKSQRAAGASTKSGSSRKHRGMPSTKAEPGPAPDNGVKVEQTASVIGGEVPAGDSRLRVSATTPNLLGLDSGDATMGPPMKRFRDDTPTAASISAHNQQLLTIGQLQEQVKALRRQLVKKDGDLVTKERTIGELQAEVVRIEDEQRDQWLRSQQESGEEKERLQSKLRDLQNENLALSKGLLQKKLSAAVSGGSAPVNSDSKPSSRESSPSS